MINSFGKKERGEDDGGLHILMHYQHSVVNFTTDAQLAEWSGLSSRRKSGKQLQEF